MISLGKTTKLAKDCVEKIFWYFPLGWFLNPNPNLMGNILVYFNIVSMFTPFPIEEFFLNIRQNIQKMFDFQTIMFMILSVQNLAFLITAILVVGFSAYVYENFSMKVNVVK